MVLLSILLTLLPLLITAQAKLTPKGLRPVKRCNCADRVYHQMSIGRAIIAGSELKEAPNVKYPAAFENREAIPVGNCDAQHLFEYPLAKRSSFMESRGDDPGSDRVIYDNDLRFCACVTHPPGKSTFELCEIVRRVRSRKDERDKAKNKKDKAGTSGSHATPPNEHVSDSE